MFRMKRLAAGLLAFVMFLSALPTGVLAAETEEYQHQHELEIVEDAEIPADTTPETEPEEEPVEESGEESGEAVCQCVLKEVAEVSATCKKSGVAAHFVCELCGQKYLKQEAELPAEEDTAEPEEPTLPEETEPVYIPVENEKVLVLPRLACELEPVAEVSAQCRKDGTMAYYRCTVCGKKYLEPDSKTPVPMVDLILPRTGCTWKWWRKFPPPA